MRKKNGAHQKRLDTHQNIYTITTMKILEYLTALKKAGYWAAHLELYADGSWDILADEEVIETGPCYTELEELLERFSEKGLDNPKN